MHWKGSVNTNADALSQLPPKSCVVTIAMPSVSQSSLQDTQLQNPTIYQAHTTLSQSSDIFHLKWNQPPFRRFKKLWKQLLITDGALYRTYSLKPIVMVPILPPSALQEALHLSHDVSMEAIKGWRTLQKLLHKIAYCVEDVDQYCRICPNVPAIQHSMPQCAPLQMFQLVSLGRLSLFCILRAPLSTCNNHYLL